MIVVDFIHLMGTMANIIFLSLFLSCFSNIAFSIDTLESSIQKEDITRKFLDKFELTQPLPDFDDERNAYIQMITTADTFDLTTNLREDSFVKIWPHLKRLDWLTTLRLQSARLTNTNEESLFEGIEVFLPLTIFDISGNLLRHLPVTLSQLRYLKKLIINDNQFLWLDIKSESLEELNASGNILLELHLYTPQLKRLDISKNTMFVLTPAFFEGLTCLTYLNMSHRYKEIPNSLELLINLVDLDISLNCLSQLPSCLSRLTNLEKLNASRNNLTSAAGLENLSSLRHLDLSHTDIYTPPALPASCRYINLSGTKIHNNPFPPTVTLIYTDTPLWDILNPIYYDDSESSEYGSHDEDKDDFS